MLKLNITDTTEIAANSVVPFNLVFNTNCNVKYDKSTNSIAFLKTGFYEANVTLSATNISTDSVGLQILSDDTVIAEATAYAIVSSSTGFVTLNISDIFRVLPSLIDDYARISFRITTEADIVNAVATVKKVR